MKIAILGGTGKEGAGLGLRWAAAGHEIIIGSRSAERGAEAAGALRARLPAGGTVRGMDNLSAAREAEVAVLAVPYEAQAATLAEVQEALAGKLLISVVAPLGQPRSRVWFPPGGSAALEAQAQLGEATRLVAAFQIISAEHLKELDHVIESDVLVCGEKAEDRQVAVELAEAAGMRGVHAGPLQNTPVIEGLTAVMIAINARYKIKNAGLRVTGIDNERQRIDAN
ncbi:MAG: NADPH-dependent F420 reductase [Chloroflexi bacterium]|nr:NADPH-dependent F420 reductase [Chloroflexota bacterium]MCI0644678.1 NADPH-dependent F420 reductase [Chloroflexota bacterium]MCI0730376.1 NADPH-dependent F420 reductase [Chloroflexota bacterium]